MSSIVFNNNAASCDYFKIKLISHVYLKTAVSIFRLLFRNRIVARFSKRIAAQNPPHGQTSAFESAEPLNRFDRVGGAGGSKPAARLSMDGYGALIKMDQCNQ